MNRTRRERILCFSRTSMTRWERSSRRKRTSFSAARASRRTSTRWRNWKSGWESTIWRILLRRCENGGGAEAPRSLKAAPQVRMGHGRQSVQEAGRMGWTAQFVEDEQEPLWADRLGIGARFGRASLQDP